MADIIDQTVAEAKTLMDEASGMAAKALFLDLYNILSVQAPIAVIGNRIRATTPATPGDPPRRVTSFLRSSADFERVDDGVWEFGIRAGPFYALKLERDMNHAYFSVVVEQGMAEIQHRGLELFRMRSF